MKCVLISVVHQKIELCTLYTDSVSHGYQERHIKFTSETNHNFLLALLCSLKETPPKSLHSRLTQMWETLSKAIYASLTRCLKDTILNRINLVHIKENHSLVWIIMSNHISMATRTDLCYSSAFRVSSELEFKMGLFIPKDKSAQICTQHTVRTYFSTELTSVYLLIIQKVQVRLQGEPEMPYDLYRWT